MSTQRSTPKFKADAVRQVIERGYSVAEAAERHGVSTHNLYDLIRCRRTPTVWVTDMTYNSKLIRSRMRPLPSTYELLKAI